MRSLFISLAVTLLPSAHSQSPLFSPIHEQCPSPGLVHSCAIVRDFDSDGDLDVFSGGTIVPPYTTTSRNLLLLNELGVLIDVSTRLPVIDSRTVDVAAGDIDGDGDHDLLTVSDNLDSPHLFINSGRAYFTDQSSRLPPSPGQYRSIALADVDGDSDLDVVIGSFSAQNRLWINDGTGIFLDFTAAWWPPTPYATYSLDVGDVNGDGLLDVVEGNLYQPNQLYLNSGSSFLNHSSPFAFGQGFADGTTCVRLVDLTNDGLLDIVVCNGATGFGASLSNRLYLNLGGLSLLDVTTRNLPSRNASTQDVCPVDVDGDGDLDLVFANTSSPYSSPDDELLINDGFGFFAQASRFPRINAMTLCVVSGDFDLDTDPDLLTLGYWQAHLLVNDGVGGFDDRANEGDLPYPGYSAELIDVDSDGHLDLLLGFQDLLLFQNNGSGVFSRSPQQILPVLSTMPPVLITSIVIFDIDRDGDQDAFIGIQGAASELLINMGGRLQRATQAFPPTTASTTDACAGDLDSDGDMDLVIASSEYFSSTSRNYVFLNDGSGSFAESPNALPPQLEYSGCCTLGDVDSDGDLDVFFGNWYIRQQGSRLLINNGTGLFTEHSVPLPRVGTTPQSARFGDLDGDGDLDLYVGNGGRWLRFEQNGILSNDGHGGFSDVTPANIRNQLDSTHSVLVRDFDNDGDLDLLEGNYSDTDRLWRNDGTWVFTPLQGFSGNLLEPTRHILLDDIDGDSEPDYISVNESFVRVSKRSSVGLSYSIWPAIGRPFSFELQGDPFSSWSLFLSGFPLRGGLQLGGLGNLWLDPVPTSIVLTSTGQLSSAGKSALTFQIPPFPFLASAPTYWQSLSGSPPRLSNLEVVLIRLF